MNNFWINDIKFCLSVAAVKLEEKYINSTRFMAHIEEHKLILHTVLWPLQNHFTTDQFALDNFIHFQHFQHHQQQRFM